MAKALHDSIDLDQVIEIFRRRYRVVVVSVCVCVIVGSIRYCQGPTIYQATATLIYVEPGLSQTSDILAKRGVPGSGLVASQLNRGGNVVDAFLESRTMTERVIQRLDLLPKLFYQQYDVERKEWKKRTWYGKPLGPPNVASGARYYMSNFLGITHERGEPVVTITTRFFDPDLAEKIANTYIAELQVFLNENYVSDLKRKRQFIERQLVDTARELERLSEIFMTFSEGKESIALDRGFLDLIDTISTYVSDVASLRVRKRVLDRFDQTQLKMVSDQIDSEIAALNEKLDAIRKFDMPQNTGTDRIVVPLSKVPLLALEYNRLEAEHTIQKELYALLKKQLEITKIEESKMDPLVMSLDPAVGSTKIGPFLKRTIIVYAMAGFLFSIFLIVLLEVSGKMRTRFLRWRST